MPNVKKFPVLKIILIVWLVFASLYVVYGEYQRLRVMVAQRAYNTGIRDAVNQLIQQSSDCSQPIPITADEKTVHLISIDCLQQSAGEAGQ